MNTPLFLSLLGILGVIYLIMGKRAADGVHSIQDYFLSGRNVSIWALAITIVATQLGGGTLIGITEESYKIGWPGLLYSFGVLLGLGLLAMGIGARIRALKLDTLAHVFETRYGSTTLRKIAASFSIFTLFLVFVAQGIACKKFFISIGFANDSLFLGFWAVIIAYTIMGGIKAVIVTDILQTLFIFFAFILIFLVISINPDLAPAPLITAQTADFDFSAISDWWVLPMLIMLVGQDMGQRCSAAVNPKSVTTAVIIAALIYALCSFLPAWIGLLAVVNPIDIPENGSVLMSAISAFTNPIVATFGALAILMAILSTADSLLCAIASNLTMDFGRKATINRAKAWTLALGIGAIGLSLVLDSVLPTMMIGYRASIYVLFWPILFGVMHKSPPKNLAIFSFIFGVGLLLAQQLWHVSASNILTLFVAEGLGLALWLKLQPKKH